MFYCKKKIFRLIILFEKISFTVIYSPRCFSYCDTLWTYILSYSIKYVPKETCQSKLDGFSHSE